MKKYSHETAVGLFMLVGLALVVYMAVKLGNVTLFGDDTYRLSARFDKVTGLREGNPVNMLGLEIGRVNAMRIDQEQLAAIVDLRIRKDIKIYEDAIASIKTQGLIGDKYVEIDPGGALGQLPPGGMIIDTVPPIDIGDLLSKYAFGSVDEEK